MNKFARILMTLACAFGLTGAAMAEERATKEEAIALNNAAFDHIKKAGPQKAYADFTTDKATWNKKDLYVMVYDGKANCLAHGGNEKLVGKDLSGVKDANGKPVVLGLIATAEKGGGWFDYEWPHPVSKKIESKTTYSRKPPSGDGFIGVGVYR